MPALRGHYSPDVILAPTPRDLPPDLQLGPRRGLHRRITGCTVYGGLLDRPYDQNTIPVCGWVMVDLISLRAVPGRASAIVANTQMRVAAEIFFIPANLSGSGCAGPLLRIAM